MEAGVTCNLITHSALGWGVHWNPTDTSPRGLGLLTTWWWGPRTGAPGEERGTALHSLPNCEVAWYHLTHIIDTEEVTEATYMEGKGTEQHLFMAVSQNCGH